MTLRSAQDSCGHTSTSADPGPQAEPWLPSEALDRGRGAGPGPAPAPRSLSPARWPLSGCRAAAVSATCWRVDEPRPRVLPWRCGGEGRGDAEGAAGPGATRGEWLRLGHATALRREATHTWGCAPGGGRAGPVGVLDAVARLLLRATPPGAREPGRPGAGQAPGPWWGRAATACWQRSRGPSHHSRHRQGVPSQRGPAAAPTSRGTVTKSSGRTVLQAQRSTGRRQPGPSPPVLEASGQVGPSDH